jgi:hypothetical protein
LKSLAAVDCRGPEFEYEIKEDGVRSMNLMKPALGLIASAAILFGSQDAFGQVGCNSCNNGGAASGSWPSSCNGQTRYGGGQGQFATHLDEMRTQCSKVYERNVAWMKPFACNDRMATFSVWSPMVNNGWIAQCTLSEAHFNTDGTLNRLGEAKVAAIMERFSGGERAVFVAQNRDEAVMEDRLASVREVVGQWYGEEMVARVNSTDILPSTGNGRRVEGIMTGYANAQPMPVISAASSAASSSSTNNSSSGAGGQ